MSAHMDLWDLQGNIVRAYGRAGYPHGRHLFFHVETVAAGRAFLARLLPCVTKAIRWDAASPDPARHPPQVTMNLGLTWRGLWAMGVPTQALAELPPEFIDGMGHRAPLLADQGQSAPTRWDAIWQRSMADDAQAVHLWVALNARMDPMTGAPVPALEDRLRLLRGLAGGGEGLAGAVSGNFRRQFANA